MPRDRTRPWVAHSIVAAPPPRGTDGWRRCLSAGAELLEGFVAAATSTMAAAEPQSVANLLWYAHGASLRAPRFRWGTL